MRASVDIETALYNALTTEKYSASAHTVPATLGSSLPHINVVRTGGYTSDRVIELNNVDFDVYAANDAEAMEAACALCGFVRDLEGTTLDTPCYKSEVITLPYPNPDPRHPSLGRATLKAQILTRTKGA